MWLVLQTMLVLYVVYCLSFCGMVTRTAIQDNWCRNGMGGAPSRVPIDGN